MEAELKKYGQEHLLQFQASLTPQQLKALHEDINSLDFEFLMRAYRSATTPREATDRFSPPEDVHWRASDPMMSSPLPCSSTRLSDVPEYLRSLWYKHGLRSISCEDIAVVVMAGGQGTRLGWKGPKGTFRPGLLSGKSIFQILAERILRLETLSVARASIPLYVMTSEANHEDTIQHFKEHNSFGLRLTHVRFFKQNSIPCFDENGKIILEEKHKIARNPDGNGGVFKALVTSGMWAEMKERGITGLHILGVDNLLAKVADPAFIGFVDYIGAEVGNKVCARLEPQEKVGVFCKRVSKDGEIHSCVVDYGFQDEDMKSGTIEDGRLKFRGGNICNHFFKYDFLQRLIDNNQLCNLYHPAAKPIPFVDEAGVKQVPSKANGIKLELFVFDVFELATSVAALEVPRNENFAPIKNAEGVDSPASARSLMERLHRSWLEGAGLRLKVVDDPRLEIAPLASYGGEGLEELEGKVMELPLHLEALGG